MTDKLVIFRCPQCTESTREYDLPALTEHYCKTHQGGFHMFVCSDCKATFATAYRAAHHSVTCDGNMIPAQNAYDFGTHMELQKMTNKAIKNAMGMGRVKREDSSPGLFGESYSPRLYIDVDEEGPRPIPEEPFGTPPRDPRRRSRNYGSRRMDLSSPGFAMRSGSSSRMTGSPGENGEIWIKEEPLEEIPMPARTRHSPARTRQSRKRRWDIVAPDYPQSVAPSPVPPPMYAPIDVPSTEHILPTKNVDLMKLPEYNPAATPNQMAHQQMMQQHYAYQQAVAYPGQQQYGYLPPVPGMMAAGPGTMNKFHNPGKSKLIGPMPVKHMAWFDTETEKTDLAIEIESTMGPRKMHFESKFLGELSPYFRKMLDNVSFKAQAHKTLSLQVSFSSFIDLMNVLHGYHLPWKFECRGYFFVINLFRMYKMAKLAEKLEFDCVKKFVEGELFANVCGGGTAVCDCVGCIERVVVAKSFNFEIPQILTFSPNAAFAWLKDCEELSCAPELNQVGPMTTYLRPFTIGIY